MVSASIGYNELRVTLAVFQDQETAERLLLEWGAKRVTGRKKFKWVDGVRTDTGEVWPPQIQTTEAFAEFFETKGFGMYSTGGGFDGFPIHINPCVLNEPCMGYNDD